MKTWIIGNWKNNPASLVEATELASAIKNTYSQHEELCSTASASSYSQTHMVMPSTLHLSGVQHTLTDSNILLGAQDVGKKSATTGAYTGDVSATQLADVGARFVLVGHSERREYYQENADTLSAKMDNAVSQGLGVVFCVGESLEQYEAGQTLAVLKKQLSILSSTAIPSISGALADSFIVAYEPIWAIGTGKVPTVAEVETVHQAIKETLIEINSALAPVSIIYGGSVNASNAQQFAQSQWVQGALIGGASLQADKFIEIAHTFYTTKSALYATQ